MGDRQKQLEANVQIENYDLIAITETWQDEPCDWSIAVNSYRLFRRQGRSVEKECEELSLKNSNKQIKNLCMCLLMQVIDSTTQGNAILDRESQMQMYSSVVSRPGATCTVVIMQWWSPKV